MSLVTLGINNILTVTSHTVIKWLIVFWDWCKIIKVLEPLYGHSGSSLWVKLFTGDDVTLTSWTIVIHKDKIRPELFTQVLNDAFNDVVQVVWACVCSGPKVLGSSVETKHTCPQCDTTTTKGSSGDNILFLATLTTLAAIISAQHKKTENNTETSGLYSAF